MRKLLAFFGSSSSEDSANKTQKTRTKNETEEITVEKPEVKGQSKQTTQYDEKKGKSKKKPQANDFLREEDNKDTKLKKKKSRDRNSSLGEKVVDDNSPPFDPNQKRRLKYGYFDQESGGDGRRSHNRRHSAQANDEDDDNLPLGIQKNRSASSLGFCYQNHTTQEYIEEKRKFPSRRDPLPNGDLSPGLTRPPSVSVTSLSHSTPSPVATTPPLVSNNRRASRESRQYLRERKFSSSNSSESSDGGIQTYGNRRASQYSGPPSGKSQCYHVVSPGWNGELDYYEENHYNDYDPRNLFPSSTPIKPVSRMRNLSLNITVPRSDPFTRNVTSSRRASDGAILSGANPITEKEKKSMKIADYHKYQEGNIAAQYHKYRVNPLPVAGEEITPGRPMTPTLLHIQQEYKSVNARRFVELNDGVSSPGRNKRTSQIETSRRISMTESNSGRTRSSPSFTAGKPPAGRPEHRKNQSETTIMQQQLHVPRAPQPQRHTSLSIHLSSQFQNSATSLSSSGSTSGSGGPPTPNGKQSSAFGGSNMTGRPGTPSSVDGGYIKEKRKRNTLSVVNRQLSAQNGIY